MDTLFLQLRPSPHHRRHVHHLYVVKDCGRMTGPGGSRFSSAHRNLGVVHRVAPRSTDGAIAVPPRWTLIDSPPRYGHQPRRHALHGWTFGFKCFPHPDADFRSVQPMLGELQRRAAPLIGRDPPLLDELVLAIDDCIESMRVARLLSTPPSDGFSPGNSLRERGRIATRPVCTRTCQRQTRSATGLGPKRWSTLARFSATFGALVHGQSPLATLASDEGYADQAHMTGDIKRHSGYSPARLRRFAARFVALPADRVLSCAALLSRVQRLLHVPPDRRT